MITEQEFYSIVAKHPKVRETFDSAVSAMTQMARGSTRPGVWARIKLARLTFDYSHALGELLTVYGQATGCRRPRSDMDSIGDIVHVAAKYPDRNFNLIMFAMAGICPDAAANAESRGPGKTEQADLPDIEVANGD